MSLNLSLFFGYHHGLPRNKIEGAKAKCKALGESHARQWEYIYIIYIWLEFIYRYTAQLFKFCFPIPKIQPWLILILTPGFDNDRRNEYDGEEEFWVTTKEMGKKTESMSFEENASTGEGGHTLNFLSVHFIGT